MASISGQGFRFLAYVRARVLIVRGRTDVTARLHTITCYRDYVLRKYVYNICLSIFLSLICMYGFGIYDGARYRASNAYVYNGVERRGRGARVYAHSVCA